MGQVEESEQSGDITVVGGDGFVSQIVKSVFEPGVNASVVMAMNICFLLLLMVLFALAVLTHWNKHVLLLLGVTAIFWASMLWFIVEISKVQVRPDNMPIIDTDTATTIETKKDR